MPLLDRHRIPPPAFPPPVTAAAIDACVEHAALRDPYGDAINAVLAAFYLAALGLSTALEGGAAVLLVGYTLLRLPNTWRSFAPLLASPVVAAVLLFFGWTLLGRLWAPDAGTWADVVGGFRGALLLFAFYPVRRHWRLLVGGLLVGTSLQAFIQVLQAFGWVPIHGVGNELRPAGLHSHPAHVAICEAVAAVLALAWLPEAKRKWTRAILLAAAALLICGIALAAGRAAILGLLVALPLLAVFLFRHTGPRIGLTPRSLMRRGGAGLLVVAVVATIVWATGAGGLRRQTGDLTATADVTTSTGQRFLWWRASLRAFSEHPIIGAGPGASPAIIRDDAEVRDAVRRHPAYGEAAFFVAHPHSTYLQTLAEQGLVGAGLLALVIGTAAVSCWRAARDHPILAGAAAALVVWAVAAGFDALHLSGRATGLAAALLALAALPRRHRDERPLRQGEP